MYLLAVESFMEKSDTDYMSWFQISGIHGYPYQPFQYPQSSVVNRGTGYCTHHSVIFGAWHRPYLALLEQALNTEARAIAAKITGPDARRWRRAAYRLRLPYWDWSDSNQKRLPDAVLVDKVTVTKPGSNGEPASTTILNPLLRYTAPPEHSRAIGKTTTRSSGASDSMAASFTGRKQQTMDLFAITDYNRFQRQLESIHDGVHVTVGGSMGVINYAAFDPIFCLHHANVDRLMAMYQNVQPNSFMTPGPRSNTLALGGGPGVNDTSTTPLYPFRHPSGVEWIPDEVKSYTSIFEFGYSYPEVPRPNQAPQARDTIGAKDAVGRNRTVTLANQLYAPDGAADQTRTEYSTVVLLDSAEFTESCRVLIYLSPSPGTQDVVGFAPVFVGEPGPQRTNTLVNTTVPLTESLQGRGYASMEPDTIVPVLTNQLFWLIEKASIPLTSLPSTKSLWPF
ncbi:MAG: hypothetical protein M1839_001426 [Geoglossum umbratile]|nr:MAG: hypothetical protein M1839_001426 [Geoglossum umbratile]